MPEAEVTLTVPLVEGLIGRQCPGMSAPVLPAASGWDNAMFRLGSDLVVRLPRRESAVPLLENEARWLPELAARLPLAVPVPVFRGQPDESFPWPWSIQPWLVGDTLEHTEIHGGQAEVLASFWKALHRPGPSDATPNPYRGGPLSGRAEVMGQRLERLSLAGWKPGAVLEGLWSDALAAPMDRPPVWIHADLHPRNVLASGGRLTGILDWGDLTVGDPAVDLAAAWMLLPDPGSQTAALSAYGGATDATLGRSLGWALVFGVMFLEAGLGDAGPARLGHTILGRVERFARARRGRT